MCSTSIPIEPDCETLLEEHELELLLPEEQVQYRQSLEATDIHEEKLELRDLASFARGAWPVLEPGTELKWNWHLDLICEYLTLVQQRVIRRLIINVPPQTMKSRLVNVFYPTWSWSQIPSRRFLSSSYSGLLSDGFNVDRSKLVQSDWYQSKFPGMVTLTRDAMGQIVNSVGGSTTATSTGGTATGQGAHDVIIDDPVKAEDAFSELALTASNRFFDETLRTRLSDQVHGAFIVVMQRLEYMDLTGHLLQNSPDEWTHIKLPMEAEENERWVFPISKQIVERKPGDLLWPERFPEEVIRSLKAVQRTWAGQYQQRPSPLGGNIIKESWIRYWRVMPEAFDQMIQSWDMSFADTKDSSFVVGQVWGRIGARKLLLAEVHRRMDFVESIAEVKRMSRDWPKAHAKLVENKANGPAVISALKSELDGLIGVEPDGDKAARMYAVSPDYEAGNVEVPDPSMPGYKWVEDHVAEICRFPGKPNDRGDAASQALKRLRAFPSGIASYYQDLATPQTQTAA